LLYVRSFLGFLEYLGCYDILASPSIVITGELLPALSNYGSAWQVASLILMRMRLWFSLKTLDLGDGSAQQNRCLIWDADHNYTWEEKKPRGMRYACSNLRRESTLHGCHGCKTYCKTGTWWQYEPITVFWFHGIKASASGANHMTPLKCQNCECHWSTAMIYN
jgi:hypothetical protein